MAPYKFSAIAHKTHTFCNPVTEAKFEAIADLMTLSSASRALDFGCGNAEMLIRLIERYGIQADGVDRSPHMLAAS